MPGVTRISVAPVKGLGLVHPESAWLGLDGVPENRRFHIVDAAGRRFNQLRNGALVRIRPDYDPDSEPGLSLRLVQSPPGLAVDRGRGHVSLISTASLAELGRNGGQTEPVDGRRFRMLFELDGCAPHEEDGWVKRHLRIGDATIRVRGDVGRCAITTQNPETGRPDFDTLRTISAYRGLSENDAGQRHIPFGVYGEVTEPGRVTVGDSVEPVEPSLPGETT